MAPNNWHKMDVSSVIAVSDPFIAQSTACDDEIYRRLLQPRIRSKVIPPRANMPPPKTTFAALFMLIGGIIFLLTGLYVYFADLRKESDRGFAMFVLGLLMFTPGSYASFVLYGAYRGWSGYYYWQIPSYDEID